MTIEINKDIPIPSSRRSENHKFPFDKLEVGQSFLVPNPDNLPAKQVRNRVNSLANYFGKRKDKKFVIRTTTEGVRVWRTS